VRHLSIAAVTHNTLNTGYSNGWQRAQSLLLYTDINVTQFVADTHIYSYAL